MFVAYCSNGFDWDVHSLYSYTVFILSYCSCFKMYVKIFHFRIVPFWVYICDFMQMYFVRNYEIKMSYLKHNVTHLCCTQISTPEAKMPTYTETEMLPFEDFLSLQSCQNENFVKMMKFPFQCISQVVPNLCTVLRNFRVILEWH